MWPVIRRPGTERTAPHRRFVPDRPGRLYAGEPETCRRDLRLFLPVMAHFGLLLAVFKVFRVETRAFQDLVLVAMAALPIHYALPYRWKKPLFVAASVVGLGWIFGAAAATAVTALAAVLIGVCYLPVAWSIRAATIAGLAGVFALLRGGTVAHPTWLTVPEGVWPVLATMFMFRMMIYLYELKHAKRPETLVDTLSYFFLLPNFCFPHFPVVDYRTFQRGYFSAEVHATQRDGLVMMFRGTTHLLIYRFVYHEWVIAPDDVHGPGSLLRFLVSNYLRYLHVSGQFHIACGMLHLFGFKLPETHRNYLLASSFTDYWRRINIYWKDFMVRVVFNPVVFRLKRWPRPAALAVATAVVFGVTWFLHGYQKFWLQGSWGFSPHDALFWGILGLLVMVNVQLDLHRSNVRKVPSAVIESDRRALVIRVAKTVGTFVTITLLWSLWTSQGVGPWLAMLKRGLGS